MKPIVLTPAQRREFERRRKGTIDRRVYQRLTAVLTVAEGKSREEVAHLLGIGLSQLGEWLRIYRNKGLDALCILHYKGDPGKLSAQQVDQLKEKVRTGCFRNSDQLRQWLQDTFGVGYTPSGVKDLLRRTGVSYHKVSGFLWKADPDKQHAFVKRVARHQAARRNAQLPHGRAATTSMRVIPFGAWTWCIAAGCWSASVCWWVWAQDASG